jgi:hypothetical protein
MFGDDTGGIASDTNIVLSVLFVNNESKQIIPWLRANKMGANVSQSNVLFSTQNAKYPTNLSDLIVMIISLDITILT